MRHAFELMATGEYRKTEVLKIVTDEGLTTFRDKPLKTQTFQAVLRNPLYAGWIVLRNYEDFEPIRGLHVPITTQQTFDRVQAILDGRAPTIVPKRKFNTNFPLKCLLRCAACNTPLTGGFCKGRSKSYGRYWCRNSSCRAVKLAREKLEGEFMNFLLRLRPEPTDVAKFSKIAAKVWNQTEGDSEKEMRRLSARREEQKDFKHKLLLAMLGGSVQATDYAEANERFDAEIAVIEQELRFIGSRRGTQQSFVRSAEILLMD
ncbi:MAG: recombinase family protein [Acidobacteriaceae bacterium]